MDFILFEKSSVIITQHNTGLFIINGPQDVHAQINGTGQTTQPDVTVQPPSTGDTAEAPQEEQDLLTPEERQALAANDAKLAAPAKADPNQGMMGTASVQAKQRIEWVQAILGQDLGEALDSLNQERNVDAARVASRLYEGNRSRIQEVISRLDGAEKALPADAVEDKEFLKQIIENLKGHVALDGQSMGTQSVGQTTAPVEAPRPLTQAERARLGQLEQVAVRALSRLPLNLGELKTSDPQVLLARVNEYFDQRLQSLQDQLRDAEARLDLLPPNSARRAILTAKIASLREQITALGQERSRVEQTVRIVSKFATKVEELRRSGDPVALEQFLTAIEADRSALNGSVLAALSSLDDADLDKVETALDDIFQELEVNTTSGTQTASAGQATPPPAGMGISSAGATGQSNLEEPVEAVEGVEAVDSDTEVSDATQGGQIGVSGQDPAVHEEIQEDWSNLTQAELGMKVASASVNMGITSAYYNARSENRKLKSQIDRILQAIENGNMDAIALALIMIARRNKESMRKAAVTVIKAMKHYDEQQEKINGELSKMVGDNTPDAAKMQLLSSEMNRFSSSRQAAVSILRDIRSANDELENMAKSWLDVNGPHQRALARFTA